MSISGGSIDRCGFFVDTYDYYGCYKALFTRSIDSLTLLSVRFVILFA